MFTTNIIDAICEATENYDSYKVGYEVNRALYDYEDEYKWYDEDDED